MKHTCPVPTLPLGKAPLNLNVIAVMMIGVFMSTVPDRSRATDPTRQQIIRERGGEVMPFDLHSTTHIFTKTPTGGVQQVLAKDSHDSDQIRLVRAHLKEIAARFSKGDFSAPAHLHGQHMPGLTQLKAAKPSDIRIVYHDVSSGGQITYTTRNPELVDALHQWFDAQLSDHGRDAMAGHDHSHVHSD